MSLKIEKLEKNMAKLTIEVSAEEVEKAVQEAYQKNKGKISIPGFRKGKVPRQMIEKAYGKEVFLEDAANIMIPREYDKALEECEETIVSQPKIDVEQIESGKPFIFTAEVALKPEVKLGKYKGVNVEVTDVTVTDEEITQEIDKERERNARTISVEDRAVKDGDMTVIDFEGFVDDVAFEGGKGDNYPLTIGSGAFIPGFEEQLVGANLNEEMEVNVTFPEEYQAQELAGKAAVFKCTVKEIKEKELPQLDDDFASEISEFETVAEYQADVKSKITQRKETEAKKAKEDAVIEAIIADADMDIPEPMIDMQAGRMAEDYAQRLSQQGLSLEQYFQFTGLDKEKFLQQMRPAALKRIQSRLVLEAVAADEKITASDEEFHAELEKMAGMYQMEVDKLKELMGEYEEKQIREDVAIQKAVELVVEQAKETKAKEKTEE